MVKIFDLFALCWVYCTARGGVIVVVVVVVFPSIRAFDVIWDKLTICFRLPLDTNMIT